MLGNILEEHLRPTLERRFKRSDATLFNVFPLIGDFLLSRLGARHCGENRSPARHQRSQRARSSPSPARPIFPLSSLVSLLARAIGFVRLSRVYCGASLYVRVDEKSGPNSKCGKHITVAPRGAETQPVGRNGYYAAGRIRGANFMRGALRTTFVLLPQNEPCGKSSARARMLLHNLRTPYYALDKQGSG